MSISASMANRPGICPAPRHPNRKGALPRPQALRLWAVCYYHAAACAAPQTPLDFKIIHLLRVQAKRPIEAEQWSAAPLCRGSDVGGIKKSVIHLRLRAPGCKPSSTAPGGGTSGSISHNEPRANPSSYPRQSP